MTTYDQRKSTPHRPAAMNFRRSVASIALLRANFATTGGNYSEFFLPVILDCLPNGLGQVIVAREVCDRIRERYGFAVPIHVVERFIRRLSRASSDGQAPVVRKNREFFTSMESCPEEAKSLSFATDSNIDELVSSIVSHSDGELTEEAVIKALLDYLGQFSIDCLTMFQGRSVIPRPRKEARKESHFLIARFVVHARDSAPEQLDTLIKLVEGSFLLNSLRCDDLGAISANYKTVSFYLDTPLILQLLDFDAADTSVAARELLILIR